MNRFYSPFFRTERAEPLALFRILTGATLLVTLLMDLPWVSDYFADTGYFTQDVIAQGWTTLHVFFPLRAASIVHVLYSLLLISVLLVIVGYKTRSVSIVSFLLLLGFHERDWWIYTSGDNLMRILLFYLVITDSGAAYSIDARVRRKQGGAPRLVPRWHRLIIKYQASVVYLVAAVAKSGTLWLSGSAVYYVLVNPNFARTPLDWLAEVPWLVKIMTWGTLLIEWTVPFLLWFSRTRLIAVALVSVLQLAIFATMNIGTFPLIGIVVVLVCLEKSDIDAVRDVAFRGFEARRPAL